MNPMVNCIIQIDAMTYSVVDHYPVPFCGYHPILLQACSTYYILELANRMCITCSSSAAANLLCGAA